MLKIAIVEDNEQYRTALAFILQLNADLQLIHQLGNCSTLISSFKTEKPDVVLMNIDMPGMNGIEAVWQIKKEFPEMKVLMLTVFEDDEKIFGAIRAGANGYLLKKDSPSKIQEALFTVQAGESPMNGIVASKMLEYFQLQKNNQLDQSSLTEREKEILIFLVKGYSYKEIASAIFISIETLNTHIKSIYRKLNVHSRAELAAKYGSH